MTNQTQPTVALNDGAAMPQFGLGVFQTPPDETERVVKLAVDEGYRLVDTAAMYRNEDGVGEALLGRTDVFVTTKLGNSDHGFDEALRAFDASIRKFRRDSARFVPDPLAAPAGQPLCRKLEGVHPVAKGGAGPLDRRLEFQSRSPRTDHRRDGSHACGQSDRASPAVSAEGAARVSRPERDQNGILEPARPGRLAERVRVVDIAAKHRKTPAQVVIRWHLDSGLIAIPKTVRLERLKENIGALDFKLDGDDMRRIETLDLPGGRIGPDPATATF